MNFISIFTLIVFFFHLFINRNQQWTNHYLQDGCLSWDPQNVYYIGCWYWEQRLAVSQKNVNFCSESQNQLPASGVPLSRQRFDHMRDIFDDYVRERTEHNWKFWIVSLILVFYFAGRWIVVKCVSWRVQKAGVLGGEGFVENWSPFHQAVQQKKILLGKFYC